MLVGTTEDANDASNISYVAEAAPDLAVAFLGSLASTPPRPSLAARPSVEITQLTTGTGNQFFW